MRRIRGKVRILIKLICTHNYSVTVQPASCWLSTIWKGGSSWAALSKGEIHRNYDIVSIFFLPRMHFFNQPFSVCLAHPVALDSTLRISIGIFLKNMYHFVENMCPHLFVYWCICRMINIQIKIKYPSQRKFNFMWRMWL